MATYRDSNKSVTGPVATSKPAWVSAAVSDWEKAVHNKYSLLHVSKFRTAIIERVSFAPEYFGVRNVCSYREIFRGTLAQAIAELKQLRGEK